MGHKRKHDTIKLNIRKQWELPTGHSNHIPGSGSHDSRPRRLRTRKAIDRSWRKEYDM